MLDLDMSELNKLGLDQKEVQVYSAMVTNYFRTIEEVVVHTQFPPNEVDKIIKSLLSKGFVKEIPGKVNLYIAVNPQIVVTSEAEKKIQADLQKMAADIKGYWDKSMKSFNVLVKELQDGVKALQTVNLKEITQSLNSQQKSIADVSQNIAQQMTADFTENEKSISEIMSQQYQELTSKITDARTAINETIDTQIEGLNNTLTDLEGQVTQIAENLRTQRFTEVTNYSDKIQKDVNALVETVANTFTDLQKSASNKLQEVLDLANTEESELVELIKAQGSSAVETFSQKIDILDKTVGELHNLAVGSIETTQKTITDVFSGFLEKITEIAERNEEKIQNSSQIIDTKVGEAISNINSKLDGLTTSKDGLNTRFEALKNSTSKLVLDTKEDLKSKVDGISEQVVNGATQWQDETSRALSELTHSSTEKLEETKTKLSQGVQEYHEQYDNKLNSGWDQTREKIIILGHELHNTLGAEGSESAESSLKAELTEALNQVISNAADEFARLNDIVKHSGEDVTNSVKNKVEDRKQIYDVLLGDFQESLINDTLASFGDSLKSDADNALDSHLTKIDSINSEIVDSKTSELKNHIQQTFEALENILSSQKESDKQNRNEARDQVVEVINNHKTNVTTTVNSFNEETVPQVTQNISEQTNIAKTRSSETIQELESLSADHFQAILDEQNSLKQQIETIFQTNVQTAKDVVSGIIETRIPETKQELEANVQEFTAFLDEVKTKSQQETEETISELKDEFTDKMQKLEDELTNSVRAFETGINDANSKLRQSIPSGLELISKEHQDDVGKLENEALRHINDLQKTVDDLQAFFDNRGRFRAKEQQDFLTALKNASDSFSSLRGQLSDFIRNHTDDFIQQISEYNTTFTKSLQNYNRQLQKLVEEDRNNIRSSVTGARDWAISLAEEHFNTNFNSINNAQITIADKVNTLKEKLIATVGSFDNSITGIASSIEEKTAQTHNQITESYDKEKSSLEQLTQSFHGRLKELEQDLVQHLEKDQELHQETINQSIENIKNLAMTLEQTSLSSIENLKGLVKSNIENLEATYGNAEEKVSELTDTLVGYVNHYEEVINNYYADLQAAVTKAKELYIEYFENNKTKLLEDLTTKIDTTKYDTGTVLEEIFTSFTDFQRLVAETTYQASKNTEDKIKEATDASLKQVDEIAQAAKTQVDNSVQKITTDIINLAEQTRTALTDLSRRSEGNIDENAETLKNSLSQLVQSQNEKLSQLTTAMKTNATDSITKMKELIDANTSTLETSISSEITESAQEIVSQIDNLSNEISTGIKISNQLLATAKQEHETQATETKENIINETQSAIDQIYTHRDELETPKSELSDKLQGMSDVIRERREAAVKDLQDSINAAQVEQAQVISARSNDFRSKLRAHFEDVSNNQSQFQDKVTELDMGVKRGLEKINEDHRREIDKQVDYFNSQARQFQNKYGLGIKNQSIDSKRAIEEITTLKATTIHETIDKMTELVRNQLIQTRQQVTDHMKSFDEQAEEIRNKHETKISSQLNDLVNNTFNVSTSIEKQLSETMSEEIANIPKRAHEGLEMTGTVMKFIRSVHQIALESPPPKVESTYLVVGEKNALGTLAGSITRVKSSMNIILPKVSMMPIDAVKGVSRTRRFQLLTTIDDPNLAKEIQEECPNVQIRAYEQLGGVSGFFRDGEEEGGLGSMIPGKAEMIVTTSSDLVKTMNEVFADLWPRAKRT
ncbi:MAG: helix-turn-helix domain-containing protein [Candidatus Hermodarchaeota archaeon]